MSDPTSQQLSFDAAPIEVDDDAWSDYLDRAREDFDHFLQVVRDKLPEHLAERRAAEKAYRKYEDSLRNPRRKTLPEPEKPYLPVEEPWLVTGCQLLVAAAPFCFDPYLAAEIYSAFEEAGADMKYVWDELHPTNGHTWMSRAIEESDAWFVAVNATGLRPLPDDQRNKVWKDRHDELSAIIERGREAGATTVAEAVNRTEGDERWKARSALVIAHREGWLVVAAGAAA